MACGASALHAQVPPSPAEKAAYTGLLAAAAKGDAAQIKALAAKGGKPDVRDGTQRTPLHVAAYGAHHEAMRALVAAGADPNALERDRYDIVTIAAVANDVPTLKALVDARANLNLADRNGETPLALAKARRYGAMVKLLEQAGAR